jgi:hypothetical protein
MLAIWAVLGMLSTVTVVRDGEKYDFRWAFNLRTDRAQLLTAGPVAWLLVLGARVR